MLYLARTSMLAPLKPKRETVNLGAAGYKHRLKGGQSMAQFRV